MRGTRPIAGRLPRPLTGRNAGFPPILPPGGHSTLNADSGTPGVGTDDEELLMLFENGSPMQFEDGTNMQYEVPV